MATIDVCAEGEIPDGGHKVVDIGGGVEVAVYRACNGWWAIEDVCTHDDGQLAEGELDGCQVICPRHGARFDIRTGEAVALPAYRPVETFPVRVEEGRVLLET